MTIFVYLWVGLWEFRDKTTYVICYLTFYLCILKSVPSFGFWP